MRDQSPPSPRARSTSSTEDRPKCLAATGEALGIKKLELMSAEIKDVAGGADVVVIVGEDNAAAAE